MAPLQFTFEHFEVNGEHPDWNSHILERPLTPEKSPCTILVTPEDDLNDPALQKVVNCVRILSADAVEKAKSGHPGMPLGMAPAATVLWNTHMKYNPCDPTWINRDRFVLSAGHGSILQYSLMHLFGYESMTIEDLKSFRQLHSTTPGHPENTITQGVEVTTGPLGQGICNAVGFALAETHLAAIFNKPELPKLVDHFTYCIVGDGCLMEGLSSEVCSLAGHWKLGKLIVFYDDNSISIEGSTNLAFTENVDARFQSYGWHVLTVPDGDTDLDAIDQAIHKAQSVRNKPSLIRITTTIGYGAPTKSGTHKVHGAPLGSDDLAGLRAKFQWNSPPFVIPGDVLAYTRRKVHEGNRLQQNWRETFKLYEREYPQEATRFQERVLNRELPTNWESLLLEVVESSDNSPKATRQRSAEVLNAIGTAIPALIGGSADLCSSTLTHMERVADYQSDCRRGRNLHFGVREHGMAAICNGLALYGGLVPYCSTFLVFSDYMRGAMRTSAISKAGVIYVLSHDSILVGNDGPTHQPIEHLASFRAMPGIVTLRPAGSAEVAACYATAIERRKAPSVLVLSRQKFAAPKGSYDGARRGGYVLSDNTPRGLAPDLIIIASGSEVSLADSAFKMLAEEGYRTRLVSMPSMEVFEAQDEGYKQSVLSPYVPRRRRLVVEAGSSFGWHRYSDNCLTIDQFGLSGAKDDVAAHLGLTAKNVAAEARSIMSASRL